ncbi:MAG: hypothetical protein ACUVV4_05840 [Candidatus Bathyarchaeia archaeon]
MASNPLTHQIKKSGETLLRGISHQVADYSTRLEPLQNFFDEFLVNLIRTDFSHEEAASTAERFFGSCEVSFAAVDGTEYTNRIFDMVTFFGGAYAAKGLINFSHNPPRVDYSTELTDGGIGVSACIPMYINQIVEVDAKYLEQCEGERLTVDKILTDEALVNNSEIANWIMTFSEFYLAHKLASCEDPPRIIFMDRSLLTMVSSLIYDTRRRRIWRSSALIGFKIGDEDIDEIDLLYNRHRIINKDLVLPSPRGDYLRYALAYKVEEKGPLSIEDIFTELCIEAADRRKRASGLLEKSVDEGFLEREGNLYKISPRYRNSWSRVKEAVKYFGKQLFEESSSDNPMQIVSGGETRWLTSLDLAFLTLFSINALIEECWRRKILLIGITKDTTARDFKNHLISVCINEGIWDSVPSLDCLGKAPNTDRILLQYLSALNHERLNVPWALIEYDSAFRMIIPELDKRRKGYVSGAVRNRIMYEKLFLKTYIQLAEASTDPQLRSNVLFIDRLVYPEFDYRSDTVIGFLHEYGGAEEPVEVILYRHRYIRNKIQTLIMLMLREMSKSSIPEVFGHNMPLFIADKIAKWNCGEMRRIIDSSKVWVSNNRNLRRHLFYMSTFRERRSELEHDRRTS